MTFAGEVAAGRGTTVVDDGTLGAPRLNTSAFFALAVVATGGPLALAALYAPTLIDDVPRSAGLVAVAGPIVFALPLLVWLRYAREISSAGGLFAFVEAAAGRRVALVQAAIWTVSYLLYLVYTTVYVVYDIVPSVLPGARSYRPLLEILIPIGLAGVVLGGRAVIAPVLGILAIGQLALVGLLGWTTMANAHPVSSFTATANAGAIATASGNTALLFVCGSLPLFFSAEVRRPTQTVRRGIVAAYLLAAVGIVAAVFPLADNPAFVHAEIPGRSVVARYLGHGAGVAIGVGVAASVVGVMLVEYLALTRLLHAVRGTSIRRASKLIAVPLVVAGPVSLINPERFYADLLKPSLITLWLSQLVVVAVFPRFVHRRGGRLVPAVTLAIGAAVVVLFGLYSTVHNQVAT